MMIAIDEKKKKQLKFCANAIVVAVVVLLVGHIAIWGPLYLAKIFDYKIGRFDWMLLSSMILPMISLVLIAYSAAQFVIYVVNNQQKPRGLLKHGDKVLYFCAAGFFYKFIKGIGGMYMGSSGFTSIFPSLTLEQWLFASAILLFGLAKIVLLVVLARVFRRVMPMIEESKTMV
jgi:hypothetical protein